MLTITSGHHHFALDVGKAASGLGLQRGDQLHGLAHLRFGQARQRGQPLGVALGQQFDGAVLGANGLGGLDAGQLVRFARTVCAAIAQLQREAFGQVARTHAGRLQRLQQLECHGEAVHQLFHLLDIVVVVDQRGGQLRKGIFQVAVFVQRFDQKAQRGRIFGRQAQGQRLLMQVRGQAFLGARAFASVQLVVAGGLLAARRRITTPFAVVGADVHAAIAVPAFVQ